jgi:glycine hydroxymethyltransferase
MFNQIKKTDSEIFEVLEGELKRQQENLVLIASENYASPAVLEVQGCLMSNKYAEGYPGARYYNGCRFVDMAERIAIDRAKKLFGAEHANVQLHAGGLANMCAYYALLEPGDTVLAMNLIHGGHLSHGKKENFSGKYYNFVFYGVDKDTEIINLDKVRETAKKCRPKLIVVGASAYPRILDFEQWANIAKEVGAYLMADIAHIVGLIVAGEHPDPVPYSDIVSATTHKTLRGPRGAILLSKKEYAKVVDKAVFPGVQAGPLMNVIAAKAVAFEEAMKPEFKECQKQVIKNSKVLAEEFVKRGFRLVSGGTDNHLMLIDLNKENITGKEAADILEQDNILANKNSIPFDKLSPFITSGIRIGTPAITTRGMKEKEMKIIAGLIETSLRYRQDKKKRDNIRKTVKELCRAFPIYK